MCGGSSCLCPKAYGPGVKTRDFMNVYHEEVMRMNLYYQLLRTTPKIPNRPQRVLELPLPVKQRQPSKRRKIPPYVFQMIERPPKPPKEIPPLMNVADLPMHDRCLTMCYQRLSVSNGNHNNLDQKPTHLPPMHYPHGHRWNEPYFDLTMPKNITSLVGKSAYLGCRVKHLGNKTVAWIRHRDLHILTVGTYTYTTDQRFQTSYHRDIDEWTLQIKWAQQRDAGVYECQISTQPVRSFSVNLNIVDAIDSEKTDLLQQFFNDDAFYISSDRVYQTSDDEFAGMFGPIQTVAVPTATILGGPDLYVDKGSTINLTCVIRFSPEPPTHIFWYHQDKVLSAENSGGRLKFKTIKSEETKSILLIDNADLIDSGKYSCYPSNTEIASIRVHVLQGERPEAMQTNAAVAGKLLTRPILQPVKVISAIVGALALLQILTTFLSSNVNSDVGGNQKKINVNPNDSYKNWHKLSKRKKDKASAVADDAAAVVVKTSRAFSVIASSLHYPCTVGDATETSTVLCERKFISNKDDSNLYVRQILR